MEDQTWLFVWADEGGIVIDRRWYSTEDDAIEAARANYSNFVIFKLVVANVTEYNYEPVSQIDDREYSYE